MESRQDKRNKYFFGLGTIGRDMFYTMVSMFLVYYLTDILNLPDATYALVGTVFTVLRIFDAFNDPIMGMVVDNTKSKWGKFKPWLLVGGVVGAVLMVLLFTDLGLSGGWYILVFALCYLGWDIFYGLNDIAYWSMMPTLSTNQKEREKIGSFARICANIGLFAVVVGILPATNALGGIFGNLKTGWFVFALIVVAVMIGFMCFTVFGVKERKGYFKQEEQTSVKDMFRAIFKNDQLLWVAISMALFMVGYTTTTSFGTYFFKYAYRDENMYSMFALVLGVSQLVALTVFPLFSKKFSRRKLYTGATLLVLLGYIIFFFSPMNMLPIGIAGILLFVGQAFIQLLMLMFLADTIEYGQWKFGKRNDSVTFSVQPFINKIGGALANGILTFTLIVSGINSAEVPTDVSDSGIFIMKIAMMAVPMIAIVVGYIVYLKKFKIDETMYGKIMDDLKERGDIHTEAE
ncbi:MAG: glycoside-pentoside-hexuronide (GPH):cation symporter [Oscillospiraceae bacterium]